MSGTVHVEAIARIGCDGQANSGKVKDECGICGGDGSSCAAFGCTSSGSLIEMFKCRVDDIARAFGAGMIECDLCYGELADDDEENRGGAPRGQVHVQHLSGHPSFPLTRH